MQQKLAVAVVLVVLGGLVPAGQERGGAMPLLLPAERPVRLMQAQELVWQAYPELRTGGLQFRVAEADGDLTVTVGEAVMDRVDLMGLTRPRAALVVGSFSFDGALRLQRASLGGSLTNASARRRIRALPERWAEALDGEKAAFAPDKEPELLRHLRSAGARTLATGLAIERAQFQIGTAEEPLYWEVTGTTPVGETVRLGYEPYQGRLVRFERVIGGRP